MLSISAPMRRSGGGPSPGYGDSHVEGNDGRDGKRTMSPRVGSRAKHHQMLHRGRDPRHRLHRRRGSRGGGIDREGGVGYEGG